MWYALLGSEARSVHIAPSPSAKAMEPHSCGCSKLEARSKKGRVLTCAMVTRRQEDGSDNMSGRSYFPERWPISMAICRLAGHRGCMHEAFVPPGQAMEMDRLGKQA